MAKARLFDLPETKGSFQLKGIVSGMSKDNAYKELVTKSNKVMRFVNFGVSYQDGKTLYANLQGIEQDNVYFSKPAEKKGEKADVQKVPWEDRFNYNREGYRLIGKNIGVRKIVNNKGEEVNDKKVLTDFDACREIEGNLKDGSSVFMKGNLDYSSFTDNDNNKRMSVKLIPNQVSLCSKVDFNDKEYVQQNDFNQVIIFMGIDQEKDDNNKPTGRFIVSAKIVTYATIEDVEFIIEDSKLASKFKKSLKPYWAIKVHGQIVSSTQVEEIADDEDEWGEADPMTKVNVPVKREFIIKGANGKTIEKELYSEDKVMEAMQRIAAGNNAEISYAGDNDDDGWGDVSSFTDEDSSPWG